MQPVMDNKGSNCIKEVFSVKAIAALFLSMLLLFSASHAEILHSPEVDPDFAGIGISAHEAIVLTDNLCCTLPPPAIRYLPICPLAKHSIPLKRKMIDWITTM